MMQNGVNTPVSSGGSSAGSIPMPTAGEVRLMVRKCVKWYQSMIFVVEFIIFYKKIFICFLSFKVFW